MYLSIIIVLLAHVLLSTPAESNSLYEPNQAQPFLPNQAFPQILRDFSGIISNGPIFADTINNGMEMAKHWNGQDKKAFESNCSEGSTGNVPGLNPSPESGSQEGLQQPQGLTGYSQEGCNQGENIQNGFPPLTGSAALPGLSSQEAFVAQAIGLNLGKEKENGGKEQTIQLKFPNRPKTIPQGTDSKVISFVINEPSKTFEKKSQNCTGKIAIIPSDHKQSKQHGPLSTPKPKNLINETLAQTFNVSSQPKKSTVVPQQQTPTTERTTNGRAKSFSTTMSVINPTTRTQSSTKVARKLRSATGTRRVTTVTSSPSDNSSRR